MAIIFPVKADFAVNKIDQTMVGNCDSVRISTKISKDLFWTTKILGGPLGQPSVLFEYDPSLSQDVPLRLLDGFHGYFQTDGYAG